MPSPYAVPLPEARHAFVAELNAFEAASFAADDLALLGAARAHGWSRVDCLVHVRIGLQELLAGMSALTDRAPDVDAASYWSTWEEAADPDPVPGILMTRRTAAAYARPTHAGEHLRQVAAGLERSAAALPDGAVSFQGHVLSTGDLLATWAVELAVHHLDLDLSAPALPPDAAALRIARRTVEALHGAEPYAHLDDRDAVLAGFGRSG